MSSDVKEEEKVSSTNEEETASAATSEEYEIVKENSPSPEGERLVVSDKESMEESLKECIEENGDGNQTITDLTTVINNENLLDDPDHTIFHNVVYLGSVRVNNPKDEATIQEHMAVMNQSSVSPLSVTVSVPRSCNDSVVLRETNTRTRVAQFRIHRIIFFARGQAETNEKSCFAFTSAVGDGQHSHVVQCHVFRCQLPEAVNKIFISFAKAFKKPEGENVARSPQSQHEEEHIVFEIGLEIREDDGKGNFIYVPRDKDCFKLRSNIEKCVVITMCQVSDNLTTLKVDRCFGMLVSPGRNVRHSDMQLLEDVRMTQANSQWSIQGSWDPREAAFAVLNQETGPEIQSVYMTVAADLVINQIAEPVRFVVETKVKIYPSSERFWYYTKRLITRRYRLVVRRMEDGGDGFQLVEVVAGEVVAQPLQGRMSALTSTLSTLTSSWRGAEPSEAELLSSSAQDEGDDDSGDEPILSGSGGVSKECSETELEGWAQVLQNWPPGGQRPKQLSSLVQAGVPEALRGEVWQRLSGASEKMDLTVENYRELVTKESPDEKVIFRDIHRTFPAHEFFKESGGGGQEALYRISKAYSVYDSEIGYCQGQSFLIAALLLQMPEEQAFGVLVEIMFAYNLRDLYRENFEQLQLRFYQLNRLLEKTMPDLWQHFQQVGLETHMFASQWFLTLFSAKFPLFLVFRVLDVFMLQGVETIFQVSLALLMMVKRELLAQDFEGIMKYFRVNIPKKLRSEEHAKQLMKTVCSIKIKKLAKYEKEWRQKMEMERLAEDPVTRFERENKKLISDNMRLERENDVLAQQLLTRQITMRAEIDKLEDMNANLEKEIMLVRKDLGEKTDEKTMLAEEADQLKLVLKREVDRMETELKIKENIITDYKKITAQLSTKVDKMSAGSGSDSNTSDPQSPVNGSTPLTTALDRIKELELELAQTKLALVETECKNQDLTHQFMNQSQDVKATGQGSWFTKTLGSIKEVTGSGAKTPRTNLQQPEVIKKSTSEQVLGSNSSTGNNKAS